MNDHPSSRVEVRLSIFDGYLRRGFCLHIYHTEGKNTKLLSNKQFHGQTINTTVKPGEFCHFSPALGR